MDFKELVTNRYSCRSFSDKEVEYEKIEEIVKIARMAPTAKNLQPYKIFYVKSDKSKEIIKNSTPCIYGANEFLIVGAKKDEAWVRKFDGKNFSDVDAAIVATHIILAATSLGLNSLYVGHFDAPYVKENIQELRDYELIALFPIGHETSDSKPSERHYERKDVKDILESI